MTDKAPQAIAAMFDEVAPGYDKTNSLISFGLVAYWRRQVMSALDVAPREWILDFAAGTGASTLPLLAKGAYAVAVDFSVGMLTQGARVRPSVPFVAGDGVALPFRDDCFAGVTVSFGLRNCEDTKGVLGELFRVSRRGGRIVVCEFSHPTNSAARALYHSAMPKWLPQLARLNGGSQSAYRYLVESIRDWYDQPSLANVMTEVGWHSVSWRNLAGGAVAIHRAVKP